jgi:phage-related minor tail protein
MPTATDTFLVRPDRAALRRLSILQAVSLGCITLVSGVRAFTEDGWWAVVSAISAVILIVCVIYQVIFNRRLKAADALAEVAPWGMRVNDLGRGWVELPWEAIDSVRKDFWGRVVVRSSRARRGRVFILTKTTDHDAGQVLAAVHHVSGGRH